MADDVTSSRAPADWPMSVRVGHGTAVGRVRSANEDSILCEPLDSPAVPQRGLFCAVADGMGGHAAGDVASLLAVRTARDVYYRAKVTSADQALKAALEAANSEVFTAGSGKSGRGQMGSTLTAFALLGREAVVGHVGDSRLYRIHRGRIEQLTRDHSWVAEEVAAGAITAEEARVHPRRNIITRALGLQPRVDVDVQTTALEPGSSVLLCSDGLHGPVRDEEILSYVLRLPPQEAVDRLIDLANERGGPDNISVLIVTMAGAPAADTLKAPAVIEDVTRRSAQPTTLDTDWSPRVGAPPPPSRPMPASSDRRAPEPAEQQASGMSDAGTVRSADGRPEASPAPHRGGSGRARTIPMAVPAGAAARASRAATPSRSKVASERPSAVPVRLLIGLLALALLGAVLAFPRFDLSSLLAPGALPTAATLTPVVPSAPTSVPLPAAGSPTPTAGAPIVVVGGVPPIATAAASGPTSTPSVTDVAPVVPDTFARSRELEVVQESGAVRQAPVVDGPIVGRLDLGSRVTSDADVVGESINGSTRWYLVGDARGALNARGFVHSSVVRELP